MSVNKIASVALGALGIFAVIGLIILIFKKINKRTETRLYSEKAFNSLQNKDKLKDLDKAISEYHSNGEWKEAV